MKKKNKKKLSDIIFHHSQSLWVGIVLLGPLLGLLLYGLWSSGNLESTIDVIILRLVVSIAILFFSYCMTMCILEFQDYIKLSEEGIEYVLHPFFKSFIKGNRGFISWKDVKDYTITETYYKKLGTVRLLVLNLYDKEEPVKISFDTLHGGGMKIRHYVEMFSNCKYYGEDTIDSLKINYNELFKKKKPNWYYPKKVKKEDES